VVTEICVLAAARGLLALDKQVVLVADAIQALSAENAERALEEIRALGGSVAGLGEILAG